jgi:D-ribose pyranose/furanose isomerase RbsD
MHKSLLALSLLLFLAPALAAQTAAPVLTWREKVAEAMPLLGHRNWILIVDSAYPLQAAAGIETIETDASQLEVVHHVLGVIDRSIHVRPVITMDSELPFVPENDAPGVSTYRTEISDVLHNYPVESLPHERVLANIEEASKHFNVLVLKTNMAVPYTSVFIRLDCKYWSADAEKRMRAKMAAGSRPGSE